MKRPNQISLGIAIGLGAAALLWIAFGTLVAPGLIESAYRSESLAFLNGVFGGRAVHPLQMYLETWRVLSRGLLVNWLGLGVLALVLARPETWRLLRRAFGSTPAEVFHAAPKLMIAVVGLSLWLSEWYPFSQFPMYSTFGPWGGYVFLTDAEDEPIAASRHVHMSLDAVRKIFQANLAVEHARRGIEGPRWWIGRPEPKDEVVEAAAVHTLRYLQEERSDSPEGLKLWRTRIAMRDAAIYRERELLGEIPAR